MPEGRLAATSQVGLGWEGVTASVGGANKRGNPYGRGHLDAVAEAHRVRVKTLDLRTESWRREKFVKLTDFDRNLCSI